MIQDKYEYRDYLMQLNKLLNLRLKILFLQQDLRIFKEDPAMNRERESYIRSASNYTIPMRLEVEKVIDDLRKEMKEYRELMNDIQINTQKIVKWL